MKIGLVGLIEIRKGKSEERLFGEDISMRRNQLSFKIESFAESGNNKVEGYIDANSIEEVLHEMVSVCHKLYASDVSFDKFILKIVSFDENKRFGSTEIRRQ